MYCTLQTVFTLKLECDIILTVVRIVYLVSRTTHVCKHIKISMSYLLIFMVHGLHTVLLAKIVSKVTSYYSNCAVLAAANKATAKCVAEIL